MELPKKLTTNEKDFELNLSHSLFDMRLDNAFGKRPQQYDVIEYHFENFNLYFK